MRAAASLGCGLIVGLALQSLAGPDAITVDGTRIENVLITKTSSFYYVQVPSEGRTLNIPVDNVDEASVTFNKDPFYRDKLKAQYQENKERREAGEEIAIDPAFRVSPGETMGNGGAASAAGTSAPAAGGGAAGLGVPRTQVESLLKGFSITFQPGPGRGGHPNVVAQMPDGSRIELLGPPEKLTGIIASGTGAQAQVNMMMQQLQMMVMQLQPQAAGEINGLITEAQESGSAQRNVGGVSLSLTQTKQGENATIEFKMLAEG